MERVQTALPGALRIADPTGIAIVLATLASYAAALAIRIPLAVPLLNALTGVPFMVVALKRGDLRLAVTRMLLWALTMGVCATLWSYARPEDTEALFIRAGAYRVEMFHWVMTGQGAESSPAQFIPLHLRDAALFSALAVLTGGVLAMPMGAMLMNYMGHYVGTLAAASRHPILTIFLGWHPWAVIRVVCFVVIGVVLSAPIWSRVARPSTSSGRPEALEGRGRIDWTLGGRLLAFAGAGLLLDILLKTLLAPTWQRLLLRTVGW